MLLTSLCDSFSSFPFSILFSFLLSSLICPFLLYHCHLTLRVAHSLLFISLLTSILFSYLRLILPFLVCLSLLFHFILFPLPPLSSDLTFLHSLLSSLLFCPNTFTSIYLLVGRPPCFLLLSSLFLSSYVLVGFYSSSFFLLFPPFSYSPCSSPFYTVLSVLTLLSSFQFRPFSPVTFVSLLNSFILH